MIYFSPFIKIISNAIAYKNGILLYTSLFLTTINEIMIRLFDIEFLGKPISLLLLISILFICDFIIGSAASSYEARQTDDEKIKEDKKFKSSKITFTFFKFIMLFLWIWLEDTISKKLTKIESLFYIYSIVRNFPIILIALREYVSIGENIERLYNKKPYMFTLADKIFELLEFNFLKKLKNNNQAENED